jgi:uncharacterized glyoxalase superfamily protein PhnB
MSKRPPRPAKTPWLSPYLIVKDAAKALEFYHRAFGFARKTAVPAPDGRITHAEMTWQEARIILASEGVDQHLGEPPARSGVVPPVGLYMYCDDVDDFYARAVKAGAKAIAPPEDMFWGDRVCRLSDPDGYAWIFATNLFDYDPFSTVQ